MRIRDFEMSWIGGSAQTKIATFVLAFSFVSTTLFFCSSVAIAKADSSQIKLALESQPNCQNFVRVDNDFIYLGFGSYLRGAETRRSQIPGHLRVVPIGNPSTSFDLQTHDSVTDAARIGDRLYILTFSEIEEWDLGSRQFVASYPTTSITDQLLYREHATAFALYQNKFFIAHGRLGISVFSLTEKRLTKEIALLNQQRPLESQARDIAINGKKAFIVMDNFSFVARGTPAFRGVITLDLDSETVDQQTAGLDAGAESINVSGGLIYISYDGPLWTYSLQSLSASKVQVPVNPRFQYPSGGHPSGKMSVDQDYLYACMVENSSGSGWSHHVPRAIPLSTRHAQLF